MKSHRTLILSNRRNELIKELDSLYCESITLTSPDSLSYIGLANYRCVVIDSESLKNSLRKVSMGIRDDSACQALWYLLSESGNPEVFFLVEKKQKPDRDMTSLGVKFITLREIPGLALSSSEMPAETSSSLEKNRPSSAILTADDIREMHQKGINRIPANAGMTPWAAEVADSLRMQKTSSRLHLLYPVVAESRRALKEKGSELFDLSSRHPEMLFIVNELHLPVFNSLFPALQGRTVAPRIHWESHGAYTGESSVQMLVDQRCAGAIIPATKPYTDPTSLHKLLQLAAKTGLTLFSTFTLASSGSCDIIATNNSESGNIVPLYPASVLGDNGRIPESGAIIADMDFLRQLALRKGRQQ
jgi:hypothetical protein